MREDAVKRATDPIINEAIAMLRTRAELDGLSIEVTLRVDGGYIDGKRFLMGGRWFLPSPGDGLQEQPGA